MKKNLITGSSGYLAPYICIELGRLLKNENADYNVMGLYNSHPVNYGSIDFKQCDLTDFKKLDKIFDEIKPDIVYHLASVTPTRIGNKPDDFVYFFNRDVTAEIAKLCSKYDSLMFYTSTDLVYNEGHNIKEDTGIINPQTVYAKSKLMGEDAVRKLASKYIIFRTSLVYGFSLSSYTSFFDIAYKNLSEGKPVHAFADQYRNAIYAEDAARIMTELIHIYKNNDIINLCGDEELSRYDMCKTMAEVFCFPPELVLPASCDEFKEYPLVKRIGLNNEKMKRLGLKTGSYKKNLIKSLSLKPTK